jgi:6,7-dimethyl-8-ribityllumazine synthase
VYPFPNGAENMPRTIEGRIVDSGGSYVIVAARFNDLIVNRLVDGCVSTLRRHGVDDDRIDVVWVPGAFELPLVCQRVAESKQYAAVIALGAVIRGATPHFDYVAGQAASGVTAASLATGVPMIFGVLTTDTIEQAIERAGTKAGNKGADAGVAAIEMVSLLGELGA